MARAVAFTEIEERTGTSYPAPFHHVVAGRHARRLADAFGLTQFGVNLVRLAPGAASALRHAHSAEDEFVFVIEGAPTLISNAGEQALAPGMVVGFPAGTGDAHHLVNSTETDVIFLVAGSKDDAHDTVTYPDDDLRAEPSPQGRRFVKGDGSAY